KRGRRAWQHKFTHGLGADTCGFPTRDPIFWSLNPSRIVFSSPCRDFRPLCAVPKRAWFQSPPFRHPTSRARPKNLARNTRRKSRQRTSSSPPAQIRGRTWCPRVSIRPRSQGTRVRRGETHGRLSLLVRRLPFLVIPTPSARLTTPLRARSTSPPITNPA